MDVDGGEKVNQFSGLTASEVLVRQTEFGANLLSQREQGRTVNLLICHQFKNPLVILLIITAALAAYLGALLDALIIIGTVGLNLLLGFLQEYKAERTLQKLNNLIKPQAWVRRAGQRQRIMASDLVPGDLLLLTAGDRVAADATLIDATGFEVNEAALTGETLGTLKQPNTTLFAGTTILRGQGQAIVAAIGDATRIGQIARLIETTNRLPSPIERRLQILTAQLSLFLGLAAAFIFILAIIQGRALDTALVTTIALAVAVIPEGLPIMVTLMLAIGMERLAHRNATLRRLDAVETLGSVTVAAIDKTGTLTTGKLRVAATHTANPRILLETAVLASNAGRTDHGLPDPLETAIADEALELGIDVAQLHRRFRRHDHRPFDAETRLMASLVGNQKNSEMVVKGAPESVLAACRLTNGKRLAIDREIRQLTKQGLRVLAVARGRQRQLGSNLPANLTYLGLISFVDPPREDARTALAALQEAGIRPLMITGDHPATARTTAELLGLDVTNKGLLTGDELNRLSPSARQKRLQHTVICARITPEQKLLIVEALQANGEVVAMTGDGINDGPALKKADIGVAMGQSGTEVAKETADLILLDDRLETIVAAVEEGRRIIRNLKKGIVYLLGTNSAELLILLTATSLGWPLPLLATQLLWINLVADTLPVAGLAFETAGNVRALGPTAKSAVLIDRLVVSRTISMGIATAAGVLILFWQADFISQLGTAQTLAFAALGFIQIGNILTVRSLQELRWPWHNLSGMLVLTTGTSIGLQFLALSRLGDALHLTPLRPEAWLAILTAALAVICLIELHKYVTSTLGHVIVKSEARWPKKSPLTTSPEW